MAVMKRGLAGSAAITSGRIVDAEVKDSRHLVYYLPDRPVIAAFDGDVVIEGACFILDLDAGTIALTRRTVNCLRFLVG